MTTILIGSQAARHWFPDWREPKDVDYFTTVDYPPAECYWHPAFDEYFGPSDSRIATVNELYTIKLSHAGWDLGMGSWEKHMWDTVTLKNRGAVVVDELYPLLVRAWEDKHGKKKVNLDQDKEEFFGDAVQRRYDHDSLHRSVAFTPGHPIYERFLYSGSDVLMDMDKVWSSPLSERLDLFAEEIAATALERWVIPSDYKISPGLAWMRAAKKTIVSLTKGRSSRFVAENYDHYRRPMYDYVGVHKRNTRFLEIL